MRECQPTVKYEDRDSPTNPSSLHVYLDFFVLNNESCKISYCSAEEEALIKFKKITAFLSIKGAKLFYFYWLMQ